MKIESSHNICIWSQIIQLAGSLFCKKSHTIPCHSLTSSQAYEYTNLTLQANVAFHLGAHLPVPSPLQINHQESPENLEQTIISLTLCVVFLQICIDLLVLPPPPRELMCLSQTARAECQPDSVNRSVWYTPCIDFCRTPISLPSGQCHYCTNYIMHEESPPCSI